eukprot:COSAG06_NODE_585_length_14005_cov_13.777938_10_plen_2980_part_00
MDECSSIPCQNGAACYESGGNNPSFCTAADGPCGGASVCDGIECALSSGDGSSTIYSDGCIPREQCEPEAQLGCSGISGMVDCEGGCVPLGQCLCTERSRPSGVHVFVDCNGVCMTDEQCTAHREATCLYLGDFSPCRGSCVAGSCPTNTHVAIAVAAAAAVNRSEAAVEQGEHAAQLQQELGPWSTPCPQDECIARDAYTCECVPGWTGSHCQLDIDECASYPCHDNAICLNLFNDFECTCRPGWTGWECDVDLDECLSMPCYNRGVCRDSLDDYRIDYAVFQCTCQPGWGGDRCQINEDECVSHPCQNGGTCTDGIQGYACECPTGYDGLDCENDFDECYSSPCQNGGTCMDRPARYQCACTYQWGGSDCEKRAVNVPGEFATIQSAVEYANVGDVVLVAPGVYSGEGNNGIGLRDKAITVISTDVANEGTAENTIIDCDGADYGFHVTAGEGAESVIAGFTVINCAASAFLVEDSDPTVHTCVVRNNGNSSSDSGSVSLSDSGAGFYLSNSAAEIRDCVARNNTAVDGAGVYVYRGAPTLRDIVVSDNYAEHYGGGVVLFETECHMVSSRIARNHALKDGGGLNIHKGAPVISDVLVDFNVADDDGGGMRMWWTHAQLTDVTVDANECTDSGGGVYIYEGAPLLTDCDILRNHALIDGGALYLDSTLATVVGFFIKDNVADGAGGGGLVRFGDPVLRNGEVKGNIARQAGGFILDRCRMVVSETLFISNNAQDYFAGPSEGGIGGGLSIRGGAPTIVHCTFDGNIAAKKGGAMYISDGCEGAIDNVTFYANSGLFGGAIYVEQSAIDVGGSRLLSNSAREDGGAILLSSDSSLLHDLSFTGNRADRGGGLFSGYGSETVLRGNVFSENIADQGAGLFSHSSSCDHASSELTENIASVRGGGMVVFNGTDSFAHCTIQSNDAPLGGGMVLEHSDVALDAIMYYTNTATHGLGAGGGLHASSTTIALDGCTFEGNVASDEGGGMLLQDVTGTLRSSRFRGNTASIIGTPEHNPALRQLSYGGAVSLRGGDPAFSGCIFEDNAAGTGGGAFHLREDCRATLSNLELFDNTATDGGALWADGNAAFFAHSRLYSNQAASDGGAMYIMNDRSVLDHLSVWDNQARRGGALFAIASRSTLRHSAFRENSAVEGGGLYSLRSSCRHIDNEVLRNAALHDGGGLYLVNGTDSMEDCVVQTNDALRGGGLLALHGTNTFSTMEILNNTARYGGGLCLNHTTLFLRSSRLIDNSALVAGGGLWVGSSLLDSYINELRSNFAAEGGAVIMNSGSSGIFTASTVVSNRARWGGAFSVYSSSIEMTVADISLNVGGAMVLSNSHGILQRVRAVENCDFGGVFTASSHVEVHDSPIANNTDPCDPELYKGTPKSLQFRVGLSHTLSIRLDQVEILDLYTAASRGRTTLYYQAKTDYDMAHAFFNMSKQLTSRYDYPQCNQPDGQPTQLLAPTGTAATAVGGGGGAYLNFSGYDNSLSCAWMINCTSPSDVVSVAFTSFRTEQDRDIIRLYDAAGSANALEEIEDEGEGEEGLLPLIAARSGLSLTEHESSGPAMLVQFVSDHSVPDEGFQMHYHCYNPNAWLDPNAGSQTAQADEKNTTAEEDCLAQDLGWTVDIEGAQQCHISERIDCDPRATCVHTAPCLFASKPGSPCPFSNATHNKNDLRHLWRHQCVCPYGWDGTELDRGHPFYADGLDEHVCTPNATLLNCSWGNLLNESVQLDGAAGAGDGAQGDGEDTGGAEAGVLDTVDNEFWSAEIESWGKKNATEAPERGFQADLAAAINDAGTAVAPLDKHDLITPDADIITEMNVSSIVSDGKSSRALYSLGNPDIVKAAITAAGGVAKEMLVVRSALISVFDGAEGSITLKVVAQIEINGYINHEQILDAVVLASAVEPSDVVIENYYQRILARIELPGELLDFDTGKSGLTRRLRPMTAGSGMDDDDDDGDAITDGSTANATADLERSVPDIFLDGSEMTLLPVRITEESGWELCSITRTTRCCGDTKCWGTETPENCPGDCPQYCWADLLGDGAATLYPTSHGEGVCSSRSDQSATTQCPLSDAVCDKARMSGIFSSTIDLVAYGPGGYLERCLGFLDDNDNKMLDEGEHTNVTDLFGRLVFTDFTQIITDRKVIIPPTIAQGQLPSCLQVGSRRPLPVMLRRDNSTGISYTGSINLLTTFKIKLRDLGLDHETAEGITKQCVEPSNVAPLDYDIDDPVAGATQYASNSIMIHASSVMYNTLAFIVAAVPANGTLALDPPLQWWDLAMEVLAQNSYDKWESNAYRGVVVCDYRYSTSANMPTDIAWYRKNLVTAIDIANLRAHPPEPEPEPEPDDLFAALGRRRQLLTTTLDDHTEPQPQPEVEPAAAAASQQPKAEEGGLERRALQGSGEAIAISTAGQVVDYIMISNLLLDTVSEANYQLNQALDKQLGVSTAVDRLRFLYSMALIVDDDLMDDVSMLVNGSAPFATFLQTYTRQRLQSALADKSFTLVGCQDFNALNFNLLWRVSDPSTCLYNGCSDPLATNYNPRAIFDDGSCYFVGCTDEEALNYNQHGYELTPETDYRDDGSCRYHQRGCTDPSAWNFEPNATKPDGSCRYYEYGCKDALADNYNPRSILDCHEIQSDPTHGRPQQPPQPQPQPQQQQATSSAAAPSTSGNNATAAGEGEGEGEETDGGGGYEYDLCRDAANAIISICCTSRGYGVGDGPLGLANVSTCVYPPAPPPPWWEELDYSYFMWGGVAIGLILLIRFCRKIFRETAEFVAPVSNVEFDALAGRYLPCARCDGRLAVNLFVLPNGEEEPLCQSCFQRKTRDFALAMSLLDGKKIQHQLSGGAGAGGSGSGSGATAAAQRALADAAAAAAAAAAEADSGAAASEDGNGSSRSKRIGGRGGSGGSADDYYNGNRKQGGKDRDKDRGSGRRSKDRSSGGKAAGGGAGKRSSSSSSVRSGSDGSSGSGGGGGRRHGKQREAWTPPDA